MLTMFLCINFSTDFSAKHPRQPSPDQHTAYHTPCQKNVSVYSLELDNGEMLSHNLAKVFLI